MMNSKNKPSRIDTRLLSACAAAILSACGGGTEPTVTTATTPGIEITSGEVASATTTLDLADDSSLPDAVALLAAQPAFHAAPLLLDPPDDTDALDHSASARMGPRVQSVPPASEGLSTRGLTVEALESSQRVRALHASESAAGGLAAPMATTSVVSTYSPAQIRAAYGLPALPAAGTALTLAQAAQLGAGQTIYIVDAMHDPNAAAELAAFNQKFGLPACTTKTIGASSSLPLPAASTSACEFSVVYNTASGTMTSTAPAFDSGWATEITLDVQWAHATAPLARIVLIEAADASLNSLLGAVKLANAMGPGVVSMSFGANEGNWTASVDSTFAGTGMTYLAATGDSGAAVSWPAVSPNVVAVGGTSLTYTGTGARSETGWSGTGGGTSLYTPTPSYQTSAVPGLGSVAHRTVADVAFNADPSTGQYVAVVSPGTTTAKWLSVGGTSLSTPQWAGLIAVANATRLQAAKPALGAPHAVLYGQIATVPGTYSSAFADITKGSDGSCATCSAHAGYDTLTGLGTPNVASLLTSLSNAGTVAKAPTVTAAAISGKVGTALSFTVSVTASNPVTYSLVGAPSGMTINTAGGVTWATPVAGTYAVTVVAKDTKTGLSGQAVYTVSIAAIPAPVVTAASIGGKVGTALSFAVSVTAPNPVTYALSGAPSGMTIGTAGVVSWPAPMLGNYQVTVVAKDTKTGLSGQGVFSIGITAQPAPVVTGATIAGKPGTALSFSVAVTAPNPVTYTLSGAPAGMSIGSTGVVAWASPVAGTYSVTVTARDTKTGLSGQGVYSVQITKAGPVITAPAMTGVAGKALTGTISIADPGATALSVSLSGIPMGMTFSISGLSLTARWAAPVAGSYSLKIVVVDSAGLSATSTVPITIAAR
jgi:hypothetical protein